MNDYSKKLIVLTTDDKVKTIDYNRENEESGYKALSDAVDGFIEYCGHIDLPLGMKTVKADVICNEEFLLRDDEKFNKVNAMASFLCGQPIYGDVVIAMTDNEGDTIGFDDVWVINEDGTKEQDICECWWVEDTLLRFRNANIDALKEFHMEYDDNKPEPFYEVTSLDSEDFNYDER